MDNGVLFQELESPYIPKEYGMVKDWDYVTLHKYDNDRLYYKPLEDNGFTFCYLQFSSSSSGDFWNCKEMKVVVAAHGYGYFDGLRHIWFTDDDHKNPDGYWYYPNTKVVIELFTQLRNLEEKYCNTTLCDTFR